MIVRTTYLDILRIISIFSVIVIHVSMDSWLNLKIYSIDWQIANIFDSISRFAVPVFIMVSGALFLNPKKTVQFKTIFKKYILRIVIAFIFWSFLYATFNGLSIYKEINIELLKYIIKRFIIGEYHMWFLYTIVGLYLITPFLKKIVENRNLAKSFLVLSFTFSSLIPFLQLLPVLNKTEVLTDKLNLYFFLGYSFYYMLGHYLYTYEFSRQIKSIIYSLGLLSLFCTILSTNLLITISKFDFLSTNYGYTVNLMPNIVFMSSSVFLLIKSLFYRKELKRNELIIKLSKLSFGAYLIHVFFIKILALISISSTSFTTILSVPVMSILVFIMSFLASYFLSKIPYVNKYIL